MFSTPANALPTGSEGTIGLRLLDQPASGKADPRAQIYIIDHLSPGMTIRRRIEVEATTSAARVRLYAAAATIDAGTFLGAAGDTPNDLSTWTSMSPSAIVMAPGQFTTAIATITVPRDAAPGERYGVLWAEIRSPASAAGGVTQVNRVGIRVYLSIGPGGPPAADFSIDSLAAGRAINGVRTVIALVHNTGGRALDTSGELNLSTTSGDLRAGPYPAEVGTTLGIGATQSVKVTIDTDLPDVPWEARLTLRSGLIERTVLAELTFPAAGTAPAVLARNFIPDSTQPSTATRMFLALISFSAVLTAIVLSKRTLARRRQASAAHKAT